MDESDATVGIIGFILFAISMFFISELNLNLPGWFIFLVFFLLLAVPGIIIILKNKGKSVDTLAEMGNMYMMGFGTASILMTVLLYYMDFVS